MLRLFAIVLFVLLVACSSVPEIVTERIDLSSPEGASCRANAMLLANVLRSLRYSDVRCVGGRARPNDQAPHAWIEFRGDDGDIYIADPAALMTTRSLQRSNTESRATVPGGPIEYVLARDDVPNGYYVECVEVERYLLTSETTHMRDGPKPKEPRSIGSDPIIEYSPITDCSCWPEWIPSK